jgi:hypothetical protein
MMAIIFFNLMILAPQTALSVVRGRTPDAAT